MDARPESLRASRAPLIGLLLVQIFVGYEWLNSGLTKIVRGGFPSGLSADLHDRVKDAPGWYRSFIDGSIIPHGITFGYLIEFGEFLVGAVLIGAALLWLLGWERLPDSGRLGILAATIVAALGATFMAVNFHLANGGTHPWLIPKDGFDESVDLDSLLPMVQLVLVGVSVATWNSLRAVQTKTARADDRFGSVEPPLHKGA